MFKKVKINIKNGKLKRIFFCNIPLFEYGLQENKKIINRFLFKQITQCKDENIFYLKVNTFNKFIIQHWIDIIPENSKIFILVDKKTVQDSIVEKICFKNEKIYFIKSYRSFILKRWIKKIKLRKKWRNVGLAHLTTFWHSQKNNYENFWNIDADDTLMCIDSKRASVLFDEIKKYAQQNDIDIFSQDFYYSREPEYPHWSFGVSYTRNKKNLNEILKFDYHGWLKEFKWKGVMNLDCYFNYLKDYMPDLNLKVFTPKNLLFLHYNQMFTFKVGAASFMQYKDERIEYPLIQKFYNSDELGIAYVPRNKQSVMFDIKLQENEGFDWLYKNLVPRDNNEYWLKVIGGNK